MAHGIFYWCFLYSCVFLLHDCICCYSPSPSERYSLVRQGTARRLNEASILLGWFIRFSVNTRVEGEEEISDTPGWTQQPEFAEVSFLCLQHWPKSDVRFWWNPREEDTRHSLISSTISCSTVCRISIRVLCHCRHFGIPKASDSLALKSGSKLSCFSFLWMLCHS